MKFLIIDDDDFKIEMLQKEIKRDDIEIANSFISGLRKIKMSDFEYDGIFLDMNFPHYDNESVESDKGLELLERLQYEKINTPVCIYSSKYVDVSKFNNVLGYIRYGGLHDISHDIKSFINKLVKKQ